TLSDIDLFELNEAFASVVLRYQRELELDPAQLNVNGGAIAMGHPLGATGAMILGTALDELERSDKQTALINLCVGAGMGTATVIERVCGTDNEEFLDQYRSGRRGAHHLRCAGQEHECHQRRSAGRVRRAAGGAAAAGCARRGDPFRQGRWFLRR